MAQFVDDAVLAIVELILQVNWMITARLITSKSFQA